PRVCRYGTPLGSSRTAVTREAPRGPAPPARPPAPGGPRAPARARRDRARSPAAAHPEGPDAAAKPRAAGPRSGAAAGAASRFGTFRRAVRDAADRPDAGPETSPAADGSPADPPVPSDQAGRTSAPRTSPSSNSPHPEGTP
ncbi:hypothetical protein ACFW3E_39310, partial [Streptomyces sp. NPDC058861]